MNLFLRESAQRILHLILTSDHEACGSCGGVDICEELVILKAAFYAGLDVVYTKHDRNSQGFCAVMLKAWETWGGLQGAKTRFPILQICTAQFSKTGHMHKGLIRAALGRLSTFPCRTTGTTGLYFSSF
jgi:hypothetical protein